MCRRWCISSITDDEATNGWSWVFLGAAGGAPVADDVEAAGALVADAVGAAEALVADACIDRSLN